MLQVFFTFCKIGLFTFGGGYAMLPLLKDEIVKRHNWTSDEELLDYYSIGQSTPGIIAVNVATFIGYKLYGIKGGILATFALILPSLIIITSIAAVLDKYMQNPYIIHAFAGIRLAVVALILNTLLEMRKKSLQNRLGYIIFGLALGGLLLFQASAILIVIFAALIGFFRHYRWRKSS